VLGHERLAVGSIAAEEAAGRPRPFDCFLSSPGARRGATRDRYVRAWIQERVISLTESRMVADLLRGRLSVDPVVLRVLATEHNFAVLDLAMEVHGPAALLYDADHASSEVDGGPDLQRDWLYARGLMIGGGTLEICRNQLGERVLGLPAEPRVDKDGPWRRGT
jgi:alkylation response protein AidB-like acyl-CoA dehydrogenase